MIVGLTPVKCVGFSSPRCHLSKSLLLLLAQSQASKFSESLLDQFRSPAFSVLAGINTVNYGYDTGGIFSFQNPFHIDSC